MNPQQSADDKPQSKLSIVEEFDPQEIIKEYIVLHRFPSGGFVKRHRLVNCFARDYLGVLEVAIDKAVNGAKAFILPKLEDKCKCP